MANHMQGNFSNSQVSIPSGNISPIILQSCVVAYFIGSVIVKNLYMLHAGMYLFYYVYT